MKELIQLFTQIALLRQGPQDVPASTLLLAVAIIGYAAVNAIVQAVVPTVTGWGPRLALDVLFTLVWYTLLLRVAGRPERILQTVTAVFGLEAVLYPPLVLSNWLVGRFSEDTTWQLPANLIFSVLVVWAIAANSHVVRAALEWSMVGSVMLVILEIMAGRMLQLAIFSAPS
jgi:hypothetical protein